MFPIFYIPSGAFFLTSNNYPIIVVESMGSNTDPSLISGYSIGNVPDNMYSNTMFVSATVITTVFIPYNNYPYEYFETNTAFVSGSVVVTKFISYNSYPYEYFTTNTSFVSGSTSRLLVTYSNYEPESFTSNTSFVSGSLS